MILTKVSPSFIPSTFVTSPPPPFDRPLALMCSRMMVILDKRTPSTVLHQFGPIIPYTHLVIFRRLIRLLVLIYSRSLSFVVMPLCIHPNCSGQSRLRFSVCRHYLVSSWEYQTLWFCIGSYADGSSLVRPCLGMFTYSSVFGNIQPLVAANIPIRMTRETYRYEFLETRLKGNGR